MKTILTIFTLTVLCVTLICPPHSSAQNFVDDQIPDTFLDVGSAVYSIAFSPDGTTLASGSSDNTVKLWDVASGTLKTTLEGHTDSVYSVAFSPDGTTIASGSVDMTVRLWDVASGTLKWDVLAGGFNRRPLGPFAEHSVYVAFSPDGTTIASGGWSSNNVVKLWDVASGTLKGILEGDRMTGTVGYRISSVAFSPDGTTIASGGYSGSNLWDVASGTLKRTFRFARSIAFSPDGTTIASASYDAVKLWDVASGTLKTTLEGHADSFYSVAFSPDGTTIASGDKTVKLWDVARQPKAPKATLSAHGEVVWSVAFSPDGTILASGSGDGVIRLWTALPPANGDGVVNIADLIEVAQNFEQVGENNADVNGDGIVNIVDIILVAVAFCEVAGAPAAHAQAFSVLTAEEVEQWLIEAKQLQTENPTYLRGILFLEQLLALLTPKETVLLANYPNPFNPETWIPYKLAKPADVTLIIYASNGTLVRTLALGHQPTGIYQGKSRAAYWDGRNTIGESVASGVYFYTLKAGEFTATRKMLIRK